MLGGFILGRYHHIHRPNHSTAPAKPRRFDKRLATPNTAAECLVWRNRPTGAGLKYPNRYPQGPAYSLCQFGRHIIRGVHRGVGETVDPLLHSGHDMGEHRRSREGAPNQALGASKVGIAPDHGVITRYVAVCSPPFRHRPYRLPLGSERFSRESGIGGHFYRPRLLRIHRRDRDHLERLSVPNALICRAPDSASEGAAVGEGIHHPCSYLVEAEDHFTPTPDPTDGGARPPDETPRTFLQNLLR